VTSSGPRLGLQGKTALVTGAGRRRGLGFAIAARLASEGARVVLSDLGSLAAELRDRVADLRARGAAAVAVSADITSEREIDELFARTLEGNGRLDVLVNNAGVIVTKLVTDTSAAEWQRCVDVMGLGTFLCAREAVKIMERQGTGGRIVNISSISGKRGNPYFGAYTFAKFGIIGFTQTLAREVAHLGITVNAVCPGTVETDMIDEVRADRDVYGRPEVPAWAEPIPLERLASAEDVAAVVAFLASADADYLTGQALNVDGGRVTD
jgi:meso-butanediol dehydrogenase / (S,S)-butanediol dehydrogenase / diacetyl reductase